MAQATLRGAELARLFYEREVRPLLEAEAQVAAAARTLHQHQRTLALTEVTDAIEPFWDRPYLTVADSVARSILATVEDPAVRALPPGVGSIEQWVDNVDVLSWPDRRRAIRAAYAAMLTEPRALSRRAPSVEGDDGDSVG